MRREPTIWSPAPRGRRHDASGFTLVEVSLALMLIAVLAALALPGLVRATGPSALRVSALQIAALLREDRTIAQTTGRLVTATVEPNAIHAGASAAEVTLPPGTMAGMLGAGIPGVRFFPDGRSSGGAIVLASANSRIAIAVNADTGAIHVGAP